MKKVIITDLSGIITHSAQMEDPSAWIAEQESLLAFGPKDSYLIQIIDLALDYAHLLEACLANRKAAYPPMSDYLDAMVKGDCDGVKIYIAECLKVKAKYPKPEKP